MMNVEVAIDRPRALGLTVDSFLLLKQKGAFKAFWKSELIEGELYGTLLENGREPEGDDTFQIKLRIEDFALLDAAGAFSDYTGTELVHGLVYEVSPQYRQHGYVKDEIAYRLRRCLEALQSDLHVATEQSVEIAPYSEPQPDIILTREPRGSGAIPGASIQLVIEVSVNTARFDLHDKAQVYAQAGIAEYWVVEVEAQVIHQMWSPVAQHYTEQRQVALGELIKGATLPSVVILTPKP